METGTLYIFLLTIVASMIQRTTGFGFGIFIMTMLPFLMPSYGEATALCGLLALSTSFIVTVKMWRFISWKRLLPILITFAICSAIAICVLPCIGENNLKEFLGIFLILASLYFLFFSSKIKLRPSLPTQITAGTVSGFLGGFFGMQGPPAVLYFVSSEPDKNHYMAIVSAYFFFGNGFMTLVRAGNGFVTKTVLIDFIVCIGAVVIGSAIGSYIFRKISAEVLEKIIYAYIGISGIIVLLTALL